MNVVRLHSVRLRLYTEARQNHLMLQTVFNPVIIKTEKMKR